MKFYSFLILFLFFDSVVNHKDCPRGKPILKPLTDECVMENCSPEQYDNLECIITNPTIKKQFINKFLYQAEKSLPIYSSFGTNELGYAFFESGNGNPLGTKTYYTLTDKGREYHDGIKIYTINSENKMYSTFGVGAVVNINNHQCYMKLSPNESLEINDFDIKKYTYAKLKDKIGGYDIISEKNTLLRTKVNNTFIYAYITNENYLCMTKFKVVSNDANNAIQIIKTLKENVKSGPTKTRTCMITVNQYIECLDLDENRMYVIRIYDSDLKFLKQYELEKNYAPEERDVYHETVWLKDEISIFAYFNDTSENNAKPILVLKKLTVKNGQATLNNLNTYLKRDIFFKNMDYQFSDTENSLEIFNSYYFGISSIAWKGNKANGSQHLIVALANIFNSDKTIDNHYFDIPLSDLYDINYQSGLKAFGFKNAYGVQMNYVRNNTPASGFIVFGYGNTTDPEPINNLFDKYSSYTIKVKDFYKGIENNLFCYVFVDIEVTEVPSSTYFTVKTATGKTLKKGSKISLNDEVIITKVSGRNPPSGRYVIGLAPYLNEADYEGFTNCSVGRDMFGEQIPTNWYPDEFYGRTIEFKFTVGIDCYENCLTCNEKGTNLNEQKCTSCKNGYFFMDNTNNCYGVIPEGYYFNETKKTYMQCYETCKVCSKKKEGNSHNCIVCKDGYNLFDNSNCLNCKNENKFINYEQTECINDIPEGYYINNSISNTIDKCYEKCKTCEEKGLNEENMKCLNCDNEKGFYLLEGKNNCISIDDIKDGEYLDNDDKIIKKCNIACKTCSSKEILNENGQVTNCDSCNIDGGYYFLDGTTICTNKDINIIPETSYSNNKENEIEKECHPNCLTCKDIPTNDEEMNCITCNDNEGYYIIEGTTNCRKLPYPGYYVSENELKKCYKDCFTCSEGPIYNEEGNLVNMNCDTCNELKGLHLVLETKNCEEEKNNTILCPRDKPILKNGTCVSEICTNIETCNISNPIVKNQYTDFPPNLGILDKPFFSTIARFYNNYILFESNRGNPNSSRYFFTPDENNIGLHEGISNKYIETKIILYSTYGNAVLIKLNNSLLFLKLSYFESLEIFDLKKENYSYARLEDVIGYKVESAQNSLLRTKEENTFIYAYITTGNHLIMTKFKIISSNAENCMEIIKTSLEDFTTIPKDSRRCLLTENQFIECLDMDENKTYVIRIYDSDLNFLKQFELEKNNAPLERAYYTYHEAILLRDEIGIFVYYKDTSDHNAKPNILIKKLEQNNNKNITLKRLEENIIDITFNLISISTFYDTETLFNNLNYILSDSENSLAIINEHNFALATITVYDNTHLLIAMMNIHNNDNSIEVKYFDIPLKDLYDINYYGNLKSFGYKDLFGIQFDHKNGENYISSFVLFSFGNSTDPTPVENIFEKLDNYTLTPSAFVKVENNILCYQLTNVIITEIPDESTGIIVQRNNVNKTKLKKGDILAINEEIIVTYLKNKRDIPNGNYNLSFAPYLYEPDNEDTYKCYIDEDNFGENKNKTSNDKEHYGREFSFQFTIGNCFKNCETCKKIGTNITDQYCDSCIENYYFIEGTQNCFDKNNPPDGYYFDENKKQFKKCYEDCKTCKSLGTEDDMQCTSCNNDEGYFFLYGTKNCLKMPIPGYYIEKTDNKIYKCDISCGTCSSGAIKNENNEVTNCDTCNKDEGYYNLDDSTVCTKKIKKGEYFDESCKCFKKCYKDCLTCSGEALNEYHMNCLSCDISKGFEFYPLNSNCLNCKELNKKVNFDQTECIDDVPNGYYINETNSLITGMCHENCIKCSGPPSITNNIEKQNCITCQQGLYLKNGNCIKTYTCPYKFFYQAKIDKYADSTQKICLEKDEGCPCALPFYYPSTNECVQACPMDMIFYQGCQISNVPYGLSNIISSVKLYFQQGLINTLSKSFVISEISDLYEEILVKITIEKILSKLGIVRRRLEENLDNNKTNITDNFKSIFINLGDCEFILRKFYNISDNVDLMIMKLEIKNNKTKINQIQYEIFNPNNRSEKLDLSICKEQEVELITQIDSSLIKRISNNLDNKNIFLEENNYLDFCFNFLSEYNADVLIQDRTIDYNYEGKLCQSDCKLKDINSISNTISCLCPINEGFGNADNFNVEQLSQNETTDKENDNSFNDKNNIIKKYSNTNIKALKCIKNIHSQFKKNYILIILTILLISHFILGIIFILFKKLFNDDKLYIANPPNSNKDKDRSKIDGLESREKFKKNVKDKEKKHKKLHSTDKKRRLQDSDSPIFGKTIEEMNKQDLQNYVNALNNDKREFIPMSISLLRRNDFILSIFYKGEKPPIFKILRLIFAFINYIAINTFFFSEKNIHRIYLDKNVYNFRYQIKYIILSNLLLLILLYISKFIYSFRNGFNKIAKKLDIIFFIISNTIFVFYWLYIGSVTSLYINAKGHLSLNIMICLIFGIIFQSILALIATYFRYQGLRKENGLLYKISQNIVFFESNK